MSNAEDDREPPTVLVSAIGATASANRGEFVSLPLKMGDGTAAILAIPIRFVAPLIHNLMASHEEAEKIRSKSPLHAGTKSGMILSLESFTIGQTLDSTKHDSHVLSFEVRGSGGTTRYVIGVDRTSLENLVDQIDQYLEEDDSLNPGPKSH